MQAGQEDNTLGPVRWAGCCITTKLCRGTRPQGVLAQMARVAHGQRLYAYASVTHDRCATAVWHTGNWTACSGIAKCFAVWRWCCGVMFFFFFWGASLGNDVFMAPPACKELLLPCWHALMYPKQQLQQLIM
jgi:hypothetical protein